jgi:predicted RNase H-like HicB family nuclease
VNIRFPDFDGLHVAGTSVEATMQRAHDALLRHLLILMREGRSIPAPDNYIEILDASKIVHLDPLGVYDGFAPEAEQIAEI